MWQVFRQCPPHLRWLLCASFFFNLAFYMLIPYLAWHLRENLLLSAGLIGLLLGARHFFQQGLFIVGGVLADRWGNKILLVLGCWLRVISFVMLAMSESIAWVSSAILLTGFSAALFTPAAQALLAKQDAVPGQSLFALASVFRSGGELCGPLVGLLLIQMNFTYLCWAAALPFFVLAVVLHYQTITSTTYGTHQPSQRHFLNGIRSILGNREFIIFCTSISGYFILINQLSFLLPLALQQNDGSAHWLAALFFTSAAMGVSFQFSVSRWCERHWQPSRTLCAGFMIMACAFVLPLVQFPVSRELNLSVLLVTGLLLTLGMLMCYPVIMNQIARFSAGRQTATHYGVFYFFAGLGMTIGNTLIGALLEKSFHYSLVWLFLTAIATSAAVSVRLKARHYDTPPQEFSHAQA